MEEALRMTFGSGWTRTRTFYAWVCWLRGGHCTRRSYAC